MQIGIYPCGLYGTLRDLMGVEGSLFAFYDMPDLVKDIMDGLTDFWLSIYEKICRDVKVDITPTSGRICPASRAPWSHRI